MPAPEHQLHQPSRSADRELGSHGEAVSDRAFVRRSRPLGRLDPMTSTPRRTAQLGVAILSLLAILVATSVPARAADPGTTATPALAAADWLATELEAKDGLLTVSFAPDPKEYVDQGLTIDAILGLVAAGATDDPAVDLGLDALAADLALDTEFSEYLNGFETLTDRAANAVAKTLLLELISGVDVSDGIDLEADLRGLMAPEVPDAPDVGRFNDSDSLGWGNFANTIGQSLAVLGLDRTAGGVPDEAVDFLLGEQCPNGSFRLYHVEPAPPEDPEAPIPEHPCVDDTEGDADATAFALMA